MLCMDTSRETSSQSIRQSPHWQLSAVPIVSQHTGPVFIKFSKIGRHVKGDNWPAICDRSGDVAMVTNYFLGWIAKINILDLHSLHWRSTTNWIMEDGRINSDDDPSRPASCKTLMTFGDELTKMLNPVFQSTFICWQPTVNYSFSCSRYITIYFYAGQATRISSFFFLVISEKNQNEKWMHSSFYISSGKQSMSYT